MLEIVTPDGSALDVIKQNRRAVGFFDGFPEVEEGINALNFGGVADTHIFHDDVLAVIGADAVIITRERDPA